MKQYVQHISGQGEKFETSPFQLSKSRWFVERKDGLHLYLPKSEYRLCEPPKEWEDVTDRFDAQHLKVETRMSVLVADGGILRVRKIDYLHNGPCFIIERKDS